MPQDMPFFSVIVPTYNRPGQLVACLDALSRLHYRHDCFEVVVVDDGSRAPLDAVVASFSNALAVTLIRQANAGPGAARNTGAKRAQGEFLVFTDDDCAPAPDWLQAFASYFRQWPHCAVGGQTLNALPHNIYSTASQFLITYVYAYYNTLPQHARFFASNNLAFPVQGFQTIGGFNAADFRVASEDRELCERWLLAGQRMIYAPEAVVYHAHALTLRTFLRQHFSYGRGAFCFHWTRRQRGQGRIKVEPSSFYVGMLRYPFLHAPRTRAPLISVLLVLAQMMNVVGFFAERRSKRVHA